MADPALLPCPFCGGKAVYEAIHTSNGWSVGCETDEAGNCMGYQSLTEFARKADAAKAWNTRNGAVQTVPPEGLECDWCKCPIVDIKETVMHMIGGQPTKYYHLWCEPWAMDQS